MLPRLLLSIVIVSLTACAAADDSIEGNLDNGFYYIHSADAELGWYVERLPPAEERRNVKSIAIANEKGEMNTVTSIDMGTYVLMCHEEERMCRKIQPQRLELEIQFK